MNMPPYLRKLMLTAHVTSSIGWLGAVASFLALARAGLTSQDAQIVRAAYLELNYLDYYNRGKTYYVAEDYGNAISEFSKAIRLNPKYSSALEHALTKS